MNYSSLNNYFIIASNLRKVRQDTIGTGCLVNTRKYTEVWRCFSKTLNNLTVGLGTIFHSYSYICRYAVVGIPMNKVQRNIPTFLNGELIIFRDLLYHH